MEISTNLTRLLAARGMTQADLSRATGLSTSQVAYLAGGRSGDPRISTLAKIADALDCSVAELAGLPEGRPMGGGRAPRNPPLLEGMRSPAFHDQRRYREILAMYGGRVPTAVETRLSESLRRELRAHVFEDVTVTRICNGAEVSRRTFYRHFLDKYDLLTWTFYQDFTVNIPHRDTWVSWDYVPVFCERFERDRDFYKHACLVQGPNSLREFACARMFPIARRDFASLGLPAVQLDSFVERSIAMVYDSIEYWLIEEPGVPAALFSTRFRAKMTQLLQRSLDTIRRPAQDGGL